MATCILVSGPGHSGTRLVVEMLNRHPEVFVPMKILNAVREFTPLHQFFIDVTRNTPIDSKTYDMDKEELFLVLERYKKKLDGDKKFFLLKMPFYPLMCLDWFSEFFEDDVVFVFVHRPESKILSSYVRRGENRLFFKDAENRSIQLTKLGYDKRMELMDALPEDILKAHTLEVYERKKFWEIKGFDFVDIEIEQFSSDEKYVSQVLGLLGVSDEGLNSMMSVVDKNRLFRG